MINFQVEKFEKLIGISITANEIDKILSSLGFKCKKNQKAIKVEVPSWRPDISCLLYTSPSPRDGLLSRMPSSA